MADNQLDAIQENEYKLFVAQLHYIASRNLVTIPSAAPFYLQSLILIPSWVRNYIHYKVRDAITYPFPNLNCETVEIWEWMSNFILHFTRYSITYPCWIIKVKPC